MTEPCPCGGGWEEAGYAAAWAMKRCQRCGLLAPQHAPVSEDLTRWYETEYWRQYRDEQTGAERDNLYAHVLAWLERVVSGRGTVLDVGCGGGRFLSLCQTHGWRAVGVEPSLEAATHARQDGIEVHGSVWPSPAIADESVEAITFINVLDHLPDPFEALREAARVLKPGGLLYIRVPNAPLHAWLRRRLAGVGGQWMTILHLYGFGRRAFSLLLPRLGFAPIAIRTAPPAAGFPYRNSEARPAWPSCIFRVLKPLDQAWYRLARLSGLDRLGWGLSLEVLARKPPAPLGSRP